MAQTTHVAGTLGDGMTRLRSAEYSAVVIDKLLMEAEPDECETLLQHLGTAIPVPMNLAICSAERVVREVRAALSRREREESLARQAAEDAVRSELKNALTALLLSCELALEVENVPAAAVEKMQAAHELAQELRERLATKDESSP